MKIPRSLKNSFLILTAALSVSLGFVSTAFAATSWLIDPHRGSVIQLGSLGGDTSATDINDAGQVVGYSYTTTGLQHAFITGPNGAGMRDLGALPANMFGGSSELSSYATGINDAGQVVGSSQKFFDPNGYGDYFALSDTAFITGLNGVGMRDIGTAFPSNAIAINNSGQVVGTVGAPPREPSYGSGFITGPDGRGLTGLDTVYDKYPFPSTAFPGDINSAGQVVGYDYNGGCCGFENAFITGPNGMGPTELSILPGGVVDPHVIYMPTGINDTGEVAGFIYNEMDRSSRFPFVTGHDGAGATDLNSLVHMPKGVVLTAAVAINNLGYVIAFSPVGPVGPISPIPEPSSYALMLAGLALINFMLRRGSG